MCLWRRQNWHSQSKEDREKFIKKELFQNLGQNFNNIVNKLLEHFQAFTFPEGLTIPGSTETSFWRQYLKPSKILLNSEKRT